MAAKLKIIKKKKRGQKGITMAQLKIDTEIPLHSQAIQGSVHSYVRQDPHAKRDEVLADLPWEASCSYVSFVELNHNSEVVRRLLFKLE